MKNLRSGELKKALNDGILRLYLVAGDDEFLLDSAENAILAKLAEEGADEPVRLDFEDADEERLRAVFFSVSFFGARRSAVLRGVGVSKALLSEARKKLLRELFADLPDDLTVILRYADAGARRFSVPKSLVELVGECRDSAVVTCERAAVNPAAAAARMIKNEGCSACDRVVSEIVERCGDDLMSMSNEIKKLASLASGGEITAEHVRALCISGCEDNVYAMLSALEAGRIKDALAVLEDMLDMKTDPLMISSTMNIAFLNSYRARLAKEKGLPVRYLEDSFGYKKNDRRLAVAMSRCGRYSVRQLERIIELLYELDAKLKSSKAEGRIVLEQYIVRIALEIKNGLA